MTFMFLILQVVLLYTGGGGVLGQDVEYNSLETSSNSAEPLFQPSVTATCRAGIMTIRVETADKFYGAVHARDYRRPACTTYGLGSKNTQLNINMLVDKNDQDYCGVYTNEDTEERSVALAVRIHRTLELADDKFYIITCGKAGFQNSNNETSLVTLQLLRDGKKVQQVVYGREYTLRAHISQPDGNYGMRVKRCFSFSDLNSTVELVDDRGCPQPTIMSPFTYKRASGTAEARLFSMFRFPDSNRVHFQCDIVICKGACSMPDCSQTDFEQVPAPQARSLEEPKADALTQPPDDGALMASYSVFVVEPGTLPEVESCENCGPVPVWLLYLCIVFGILFLVMLIINLFLCTAMSCSCTKESKLDKETSYLEDFDPYSRSWHGSQYGSRYGLNANLSTRPDGSSRPATPLQHNGSTSLDLRYSLNGGIKTVPVPYLPADTTRSVSSTSEYGGAINSRPNSRHSSHRPRGPSSTSGFSSGNSRQSSRGLVAK